MMEVLIWAEFKNSVKRIDCESCQKVQGGPKECEPECIDCYGNFRDWYRKHRDVMAIDDLKKKVNGI